MLKINSFKNTKYIRANLTYFLETIQDLWDGISELNLIKGLKILDE